ncbi:MAG: radical SAM protein [Candidatus Aminicenantales bacterium]
MPTLKYSFKRLFINSEALRYPLTEKVREKLNIPEEIINSPQVIREEMAVAADPIGEGKKIIYLTLARGRFIKACPCSPQVIGCGYLVINSVLGCPVDCSYCVLQAYLTDPWITILVNEDKLTANLAPFLASSRQTGVRLGTGELADSLALEPLTGQAARLARLFHLSRGAILELKTKTDYIAPFLSLPPSPYVVFSWSLNAETIVREEEGGASPLEARLKAAAELARLGHPVGFHFDPLVYFEGWEREYEEVINRLFRLVPAASVRWVSLGCLRFPEKFRKVIQARHRDRAIFFSEIVIGRDGKWRYFKPLRLLIYSRLVEMIKAYAGPQTPLYFCMEDDETWERVLKTKPEGRRGFAPLFTPPEL